MVKTMKAKKEMAAPPATKGKWHDAFAPTWTVLYLFFAINALDILRAILTEKQIGSVVNVLDYILLPITKIVFVVIQPTYVSLALLSITVFLDLVWKYVLAALIAKYLLKK